MKTQCTAALRHQGAVLADAQYGSAPLGSLLRIRSFASVLFRLQKTQKGRKNGRPSTSNKVLGLLSLPQGEKLIHERRHQNVVLHSRRCSGISPLGTQTANGTAEIRRHPICRTRWGQSISFELIDEPLRLIPALKSNGCPNTPFETLLGIRKKFLTIRLERFIQQEKVKPVASLQHRIKKCMPCSGWPAGRSCVPIAPLSNEIRCRIDSGNRTIFGGWRKYHLVGLKHIRNNRKRHKGQIKETPSAERQPRYRPLPPLLGKVYRSCRASSTRCSVPQNTALSEENLRSCL